MSTTAPEFKVRHATPDDAAALIAHVRRIADEPGVCIPMAPGEFEMTEDEERRLLAEFAAAENSLFLVAEAEAEADGRIVGDLACKGRNRRALRHATMLGMGVRREWRGRGVGTALLERAIDWARTGGVVNRIELQVYVSNAPAIRLYERFGFAVEGRLRRATVYEGRYEDMLVMSLLL